METMSCLSNNVLKRTRYLHFGNGATKFSSMPHVQIAQNTLATCPTRCHGRCHNFGVIFTAKFVSENLE